MPESSDIEFSVVFLDSTVFKPSYIHKGSGNGLKYMHCFPACGEHHSQEISCGKPLQVMVNILVPPLIIGSVNMADVIDKLCCVGEFRASEAVPTIYKPLKGSELAAYLSNHDQNEADMYWGRMIRKFEPVSLEHGTLYKVIFEFNSEASVWLCRLRSCKRIRDASTAFCFGLTLLLLSDHSKQTVASIKYPHVLHTWFQQEFFHPVGYFDSPAFRVSWRSTLFVNASENNTTNNNTATVCNNNPTAAGASSASTYGNLLSSSMSMDNFSNDKDEEEDLTHDQSSVLSKVIASAPIFTTHDELPLATWVASMRQEIAQKSKVLSTISLMDLGFQYETPTAYRDTTNTFLPLFLSLMQDSSLALSIPSSAKTVNNTKSKPGQSLSSAGNNMVKRNAAIAFLRNKSRVPIATETATLFTFIQSMSKFDTKSSSVETVQDSTTNSNSSSGNSKHNNNNGASTLAGGALFSLNLLQSLPRSASATSLNSQPSKPSKSATLINNVNSGNNANNDNKKSNSINSDTNTAPTVESSNGSSDISPVATVDSAKDMAMDVDSNIVDQDLLSSDNKDTDRETAMVIASTLNAIVDSAVATSAEPMATMDDAPNNNIINGDDKAADNEAIIPTEEEALDPLPNPGLLLRALCAMFPEELQELLQANQKNVATNGANDGENRTVMDKSDESNGNEFLRAFTGTIAGDDSGEKPSTTMALGFLSMIAEHFAQQSTSSVLPALKKRKLSDMDNDDYYLDDSCDTHFSKEDVALSLLPPPFKQVRTDHTEAM